MKHHPKSGLGLIMAALGLLALATIHAAAAITWWDPQGFQGNYTTFTAGALDGTWETVNWSTFDVGTNAPVNFIEGTAVGFSVGAGATNTGDSASTVAFTMTLTNNHTVAGFFDGALNPNSCIVALNGPGVVTLASGLDAFDVNNSSDLSVADLTISNTLAGPGTITLEGGVNANGTAQIHLRGTNSFSGGTQTGWSGTSWSGILNFNNPYAFGTGPIKIVRGYSGSSGALAAEADGITLTNTFDWSGALSNTPYQNIVGSFPKGLTFSGPWNLGGKAVNVGSGGAGNRITIASVISGTSGSSLTKYNPGVLVLVATNNIPGATTVNAGVLQFGDGVARNGAVTNTITITSPGTLLLSNVNPMTFAKVISGTGNLTNASTGVQTFSGANTYSGGTAILPGSTSKLGNNGGVPNGELDLDGTLDLFGFSPTVKSFNGGGLVTSTNGAGIYTLTVGSGNNSGTFSGVISNNSGILGLTQTGTGTLVLSGTSTYDGPTIITGGGQVQFQTASAISPATSILLLQNTCTVDFGGVTASVAALNGSGTFNNLNGTLTVNGNANTVTTQNYAGFSCISAPLNGGGTLVKAGTGAMAFRPNASGSGPFTGSSVALTFNNGVLSVGGAPNMLPLNYALNVPSGALFQLDANHETVSSLAGSGSISLGGGTLAVNGPGTFSGTIQNSELPGSSTAVGNGLRGYYYTNIDFTGLSAVRDDSTVNFPDMSFWPGYTTTSKTNQVSVRWLGQFLAPVSGTYYFGTKCDDGSRLWVNGQLVLDNYVPQGPTLKVGATGISLNAGTRYDIVMEYFNNTSGGAAGLYWAPPNAGGNDPTNAIPANYLLLPSAGTLVKSGSGTLQLTGANTYSGGSLVNGGGTLRASAGALGIGSATVSDDGSILQLDATTSLSSGADLILLGPTASVNLNFAGTGAIHGLTFDGVNYAVAGTWGSTTSSAAHKSSQFTGNGILNVTATGSATALNASSTTPVYGSTLTLTATVTGSAPTPTGTVIFYDNINSGIGTNFLGTAALVSGTATLTVSNLMVGQAHSVFAVYSGDTAHATSTSAAVGITPQADQLNASVVIATKIYDGTTSATISSLAGILPGDLNDVQLVYTANFVDQYPATTNKTVNVTSLSLSGALAGNYIVPTTPFATTGIITNKPAFVTGIAAKGKIYDSTTTGSTNGATPSLAGILAGETASLLGTPTAAFTTKGVGTNKPVVLSGYTLTGASAGNYVLVLTNLSANITNRTTATTGLTANNKVYDGGTVASLSGTATPSPAFFGGDLVSISGTPVANFNTATVGTGKAVTVTGFILTGIDATNYSLTQPTGLTAAITQAGTTASLVSSANPSGYTSNVTFTATVTSSTPTTNSATGSVTFYTNGVAVAPSVTLVSTSPTTSTASFSTALLPVGNNAITLVYGGDVNFVAPLSPNLTQVVQNGACSATNALLSVTDNGNNTLTLRFQGSTQAQYSVVTNSNVNAPIASWGALPNTTTNLTDPNGFWSITVPKSTTGALFYRSKAAGVCP